MGRKIRKHDFQTPAWTLIRRLAKDYLRHHTKNIFFAVLLMIVVALATGTQAKLIQPALDKVFTHHDMTLLWVLPLVFLGVSVIKGFASYGQAVLMQKTGLRLCVMLQNQMFDQLIDADLKFIHGDATGKLLSRFGNDVNFTREATVKTFTGFGRDMFSIIVLTGVMVQTHWKMALVALVIFPISIFPIMYIGRRVRKLSQRTQVSLGDFTSFRRQPWN